jgi:hypothetical protein
MGDVGRYEAQLVARYPRKIKVKEKNTYEAIAEFLFKKPDFARVGEAIDGEEATLENITNGKYLGYVYQDEDGDYADTFDNPFTSKNERHYFDYAQDIQPLIQITVEELQDLDLDILSEYDYYDEGVGFDLDKTLGNIRNYIYCYNDNSTEDHIKIPDEILKDLVEGKCKLVLTGDGHGNC